MFSGPFVIYKYTVLYSRRLDADNGSCTSHVVASDGASLYQLRRSLQVYSRTVDLQTDLMFE
jgi:hypothetical protein